MLPTVSEESIRSLGAAAPTIQARLIEKGRNYSIADINEALAYWLELTIEELCDEAVYHCAEGDRSNVVNRAGFETALKTIDRRIAREAQAAQMRRDSEAIALEVIF